MKRTLLVASASLAFLVAVTGTLSCASAAPPKAQPPPDPLLTNLTQWLKLDTFQQEQTRRLLQELYDRDAKIREKWDKTGRTRPEELLGSHGTFERDFVAFLTEDQKRLYADTKLKLLMKGRSVPPAS